MTTTENNGGKITPMCCERENNVITQKTPRQSRLVFASGVVKTEIKSENTTSHGARITETKPAPHHLSGREPTNNTNLSTVAKGGKKTPTDIGKPFVDVGRVCMVLHVSE